MHLVWYYGSLAHCMVFNKHKLIFITFLVALLHTCISMIFIATILVSHRPAFALTIHEHNYEELAFLYTSFAALHEQ